MPKFDVREWEANLPKGGGPDLEGAVYNPPLNMNSIHSRPYRYLQPTWGPGAVLRTAEGSLIGIRGSFEGPPFLNKTYDIRCDSMTAQKEGEENKGRWMCLMKTPMFSILKSIKGGLIRHVGEDPQGMRGEGWFSDPGDSYIYKEVQRGGTRRRGTRRKGSRTKVVY